MFKEKLSRIALIVVCRLFSANKNARYRLSPLISEELAQSFNGRKGELIEPLWDLADTD